MDTDMVKYCTPLTLCEALHSRCQQPKSGGVKGFVFTERGVVYSIGRSDKGKKLAFCPFCGFKFDQMLISANEYFSALGGDVSEQDVKDVIMPKSRKDIEGDRDGKL